MFGDYERWRQETGALYDQIIGNFYRDLNQQDKEILRGMRISPFGDNRMPYRKDL
jgi:hypothetical protein